MSNKIRAWHFLADKDGSPVMRDGTPVRAGETYHVDGELVMYKRGLHASRRIIDALQDVPESYRVWISRVDCFDGVIERDNKLVCHTRSVLWIRDATDTLHEFACRCAEHALRRYASDADTCSHAAIAAKRAWLRHEISDTELAAARAAARAMARDAAWAMARAAARAAAWNAAMDEAWAAARDAQDRLLRNMVEVTNE